MILGILMILLAIAGATYAYFTATISDGDKGSSVIIRTGTLRLVYEDTEYINVSGVLPGDSYSKTVTVTNEGNVSVYYHLVWIELLNELVTTNDLTMEISCTSNTDTCGGLSETTVSDSGSNIPILYNVEIGMLETHTYTITLHFNETGSNQNDNQGKIISGKIGIIEARDLAVNLYGYVYDENGDPMSSTIVELHSDPISVVTDANGRYEFESIPLGSHTAYIKTSDGSSTISTTSISLAYGDSTSVSSGNITINQTRESIGININIDPIDPILSLTLPSGTLRPKYGGAWNESQYYSYSSSITSISIDNKINIPGDVTSSWTVSEDGNSTVMAYIKSDGVSGYQLHIQGNGGVFAPVSSSNLFRSFTKVTTINGLENFNTSNVTNMGSMFSSMSKLVALDLSNFDTSKVTDMSYMFFGLNSITTLDISSFDTSNVTNMAYMFYGCIPLTILDVSGFNTSNVTNMDSIFTGCSSLTSLDVSSFDTSKVITMQWMFNHCSSLTSLNLNTLDTSNVTSMYGMFENCYSLISLNISNFNTLNVTNMSSMFSGCYKLINVNLESFDVSNVISMSSVFYDCWSLNILNLSNWNTANVTNMNDMFSGCEHLITLNLSNFNTSKVTTMERMFQNCTRLVTLNISSFNTSNVTNMNGMFGASWQLSTLDIRNAVFTGVTTYSYFLSNVKNDATYIVKDADAQTFINDRLSEAGRTGIVNIGS